MDQESRVVVLIDMDCFYCQVEEKLNPELKGKPIAVVQYNPWKGGGIIAVNYLARAMGVTRHMRGDEAKEKCPEIQLPSVPCLRGKADTTKYREAGIEVAKVLQRYTPLLERASVDEAYLDISASVEQRLNSLPFHSITKLLLPNTYALGYDAVEQFLKDIHNESENMDYDSYDIEHTRKLIIGAVIVSEIRAAVFAETGYQCSAGIAHNKILAKLVCGMNKPNKQTILPKHSINTLYRTLSVKKVKNLGGKFGDTVCEVLSISKMGELQSFSEKELQNRFDDKNGTWLYNIARGIDTEPVQAKFNSKSIGCCKQFRGKTALTDLNSLKKWLTDLGEEIQGRLEKDSCDNNRTPKQMVVSFAIQIDKKDMSSSRSYNFTAEDQLCSELFCSKALEVILDSIEGSKVEDNEENRKLKVPIKFLGISVGKFEDSKKTKKILDYFAAGTSKDVQNLTNDKNITHSKGQKPDNCKKRSSDKDYLMKKFFKVTEKINKQDNNSDAVLRDDQIDKGEINKQYNNKSETLIKDYQPEKDESNDNEQRSTSPILQNIAVNLDHQESFFAKYLKQNLQNFSSRNEPDTVTIRAITPKCDIAINHTDNNSNDSNYSTSTINDEINRSISLFENDPSVTTRVGDIRNLLTHSILPLEDTTSTSEENSVELELNKPSSPTINTIICQECGKTISTAAIGTHSDYHLALRLRNEEREDARKVIREKQKNTISTSTIIPKHNNKNNLTSMTKFITKIDDSVPKQTCQECGKRIPIEKFPEHLDFHEAQRLSRELNNKPLSVLPPSSTKRKRSKDSPVKKTKLPCRPIDSFFK